MMEVIYKIRDILSSAFSHENINNINSHLGLPKIRNNPNGVTPLNVLSYNLFYTQSSSSKEITAGHINELSDLSFSRQSYYNKDKHIHVSVYKDAFENISSYCQSLSHDNTPIFAVDGCNNNFKGRVILNLGIFDVSNNIPIDLSYYGANNRNGEVKLFKQYVMDNIHKFKNAIFVFDRLYFCYGLIDFLILNGLKYVIRVKGEGKYIDPDNVLPKSTPNYNIIKKIRKTCRLIKSEDKIDTSNVIVGKNRKNKEIKNITVKVKRYIITNLDETYSDDEILNIYKSRWNIEVFFKLIKNNFKFQNIITDDIDKTQKMYYCELIITLICKLIEHYYWQINQPPKEEIIERKKDKKGKDVTVKCTVKPNYTSMLNGLYNGFLNKLINEEIKEEEINKFCKNYIQIIKNKTGRSFPRFSKTPFTKWYLKGYSKMTQLSKIIKAIIDGTTDKLNKNLKMEAKRIINIDGNEYG